MRISDWSSDVCSSDLLVAARRIDLPDAFALLERLADLDRETRKLPRHGRAQVERIEVAPRDLEARFKRGRRRALLREMARLEPFGGRPAVQIGRASCRERVCKYV